VKSSRSVVVPLLLSWAFGPGSPSPAAGVTVFDRVGERPAAWSFSLATGFDTYIHRYPLAATDTTEAVTEATVVLGLEGRAGAERRHSWLLRPEFSLGSQLLRERLDVTYQFRPDSTNASLRLDARLLGRQYRGGTGYALSSDNVEGRAEVRWSPYPTGRTSGELRAHYAGMRYRNSSTLEVDYNEVGGGLFVGSGSAAWRRYRLGLRLARRVYPDSSAIDRNVLGWEAVYDSAELTGAGLHAYHLSERRGVRDEGSRPSAWAHGTEVNATVPFGRGRLAAELRSEVWQYDYESSAYFNSWRVGTVLAFHAGDALALAWRAGPAFEWLLAGDDSPETYRQYGIQAGVESYGGAVTGSLRVEYGRRDYRRQDAGSLTAAEQTSIDSVFDTSDFNYWEIWLMGGVSLTSRLYFDVLANYQPESHTEKVDDMSIAFANARLVWRW
jgi:hypothetical protein